MGSFIDYFKPVTGKTYREMLQSYEHHQWSADGKNWVIPKYTTFVKDSYSKLALVGGCNDGWPNDGRRFIPFLGGVPERGGCCYYNLNESSEWKRSFDIFFRRGGKSSKHSQSCLSSIRHFDVHLL